MLRNGSILTKWNSELAYIVGLITSDGNLSSDGRHINITSKDLDILENVKHILKIRNKITLKSRSASEEKKYYFLQFGSVHFYNFLVSLGLTPAKSKTLSAVQIPELYFPDFLRGCIDGDGSITESIHPESSLVQLRLSLCSGSVLFLKWIHEKIQSLFSIKGGSVTILKKNRCALLRFGKSDSIEILKKMYRNRDCVRLERKFLIAEKYLD